MGASYDIDRALVPNPGLHRPLVAFRAVVRKLIAEGIAPTPTALLPYGYAYPGGGFSGPCLKSGYYSEARREELIAAGWRPVAYGKTFRWEPPKN